jgi:pimeloyl-ACP methyl ester carboxylesterase
MRQFVATLFLVCLATISIAAGESPTDGQSFQSNGVTIHYSIQGKEDGESVILLHGWLGRGEGLFDMKFSRSLLEDGYRLVVPDQRGHGKSDKPHDDGQYGVEMVSDVVRLMDHLHIERAHVIGYSMGGFVVGKLLVEHPNRIKSAVIGANGGFRSGDYSDFVRAFSEEVAAGKGTGERHRDVPYSRIIWAAETCRAANPNKLLAQRRTHRTEGDGLAVRLRGTGSHLAWVIDATGLALGA